MTGFLLFAAGLIVGAVYLGFRVIGALERSDMNMCPKTKTFYKVAAGQGGNIV